MRAIPRPVPGSISMPAELDFPQQQKDEEQRGVLGPQGEAGELHQRVLSNPGADMQLLGNDVVVALGTPDKIAVAMGLFHALEGGKI